VAHLVQTSKSAAGISHRLLGIRFPAAQDDYVSCRSSDSTSVRPNESRKRYAHEAVGDASRALHVLHEMRTP